MKKIAVLLILVLYIGFSLFADEDNLTMNIGLSTSILGNDIEKYADIENYTKNSFSISLFGGIGYHFNLIPYILAPGLYADVHFDLLSYLLNHDKITRFSLQGGLRFYNRLHFLLLDIQPFFGVLVLQEKIGTNDVTTWQKSFGVLAALGIIGVEYSYILPIKSSMNDLDSASHRFSLMWHIK